MTDYWVSVGNQWCDYCKKWYRNTEAEKRKHEATPRHKKALQNFLKTQRDQKTGEERQKLAMEQEVARISRLAEKKFKDDLRMPQKVVTSTKIIASAPSVINPEFLKEQATLEQQEQINEQSNLSTPDAPPQMPGFIPPPMPGFIPPPMPPGLMPFPMPGYPFDPNFYQQQQEEVEGKKKRKKKPPKYKQYQTLMKQMEQTSDVQKVKIDTYIKAAIEREGIQIEEEDSIKSEWDKQIGRVDTNKKEEKVVDIKDEYSYYNDPEFFYKEESYEYTKKKEEEQEQLEKQKEKAKEKLEEIQKQEEEKKKEEKISYNNEKIKEHIRENFDKSTGLGRWESVPEEKRILSVPTIVDEPITTTTSTHDENIIIVHQPSASELNAEDKTIATPVVENVKRKQGSLFVHDDEIIKEEESNRISTYNYKESKQVKKRKLAELDALLDLETGPKKKVSIKKRR